MSADPFYQSLEQAFAALHGSPALQRDAFRRFLETGLPSRRDPHWRYTPLDTLRDHRYRLPAADVPPGELPRRARRLLQHTELNMVSIDGRFSPGSSFPACTLYGAECLPRSLSSGQPAADVTGAGPLAELNRAFSQDGVGIRIRRSFPAERVIHICTVSTEAAAGHLYMPRSEIELAPGAVCTVVESFLADNASDSFTNSASRITLGEGAQLTYAYLQIGGGNSARIHSTCIEAGRDTQVRAFAFADGARIARHNLALRLNQAGASCDLYGIYHLSGKRHLDNHTTITHGAPHTASTQLYKGILEGDSRVAFSGQVEIRPGMKGSITSQTNNNLLLSPRARVNARPQLIIANDDVKASHGATSGRPDPDELFYLQTRGIPHHEAERVLAQAFLLQVFNKLDKGTLRELVQEAYAFSKLGDALGTAAGDRP